MKGIVLAGGSGTRLYPITKGGEPTKTLLGWNPTKTSFEQLVKIMIDHDIKFVRKLYLKTQI